MKDVSIIIVNYNTCQMTMNCIDSIAEHTQEVDYEIILVDNGSLDGSAEFFSKDSRVTFIESGSNIGFGRANNIGYKQASGKYLFLLNSDTLLQNNAVKLFYDMAEKDSDEVGCWGTMLNNGEGGTAVSYGKFFSVWSDLYLHWVKLPYALLFRRPISVSYYNYPIKEDFLVDYITGADIFMRKSVADKYGLFDENFFLYFEETDMQRRYAIHGIKRRICLQPQIIHLEGGSQKKEEKNLNGNLIRLRSKMYYCRKWNNPITYFLYLFTLSLIRIPFLFFMRYPVSYKRNYLKVLWNI